MPAVTPVKRAFAGIPRAGSRVARVARSLPSLAAFLLFVVATSRAAAQSAEPPLDVVHLADGTRVEGLVVKQEPGQFVTVRTPDGRESTFAWSEVRRVEIAPRPTAPEPGAPPAAPAPQPAPAEPPAKAAAPPVLDCAATPLDPRCSGGAAILDCRATPDDPRCAAAPPGSLLIADRTVAIRPPRRLLFQALVGGAFNFGTKSDLQIYSGGFEAGLSVLYGLAGPLPPPTGGNFFGLSVEPTAAVFGGGMVFGGGDFGSGTVMVRGGVNIGAVWLRLGAIDRYELEQTGIGVGFAYRPGLQYIYFDGDLKGDDTELMHGPVVTLQLPEYKTPSGKLARGIVTLSAMHLPKSGLVFLGIGGGAAFP